MTVVSAIGRVRIYGPLEGHVEGFEAELARRGFTPASVVNQLRLMAHLSRWLDAESIGVGDLSAQRVEAFTQQRRATYTGLFSRKALRPLLGWLAAEGLIPTSAALPPAVVDPPVIARFEEYLRAERRLAAGTVAAHVVRVRRFVIGYVPEGGMGELTGADVTRALLDEGATRRPSAVKCYGYTLRAFLRFCFIAGITERDLTDATQVIRSPQPSQLPVGVSAGDLAALLAACDRDTALGRREYAVIVLLARLGLRAGEVAGLRLEDIDWRHGEILVRGKGNRDERLPLPHEVGEALVDYLKRSRPTDHGLREVFIAARAPRRPLMPGSVGSIVNRACLRAGLEPFGPHRLRHTLGEQMVTAEVAFAAIGQVLRHTEPLTTAGYARVDLPALRGLAQPWPTAGGGRS